MTRHAARMRRWLLWAAPAMVLGGLGLHAGGAGAGLGLWLALGALLPDRARYPYPRKRKIRLSRLFFCVSLVLCCRAALFAALFRVFPAAFSSPLPRILGLWGAAGFALPAGAWAFSLPLSRRASSALGGLLCALCAVFAFFT